MKIEKNTTQKITLPLTKSMGFTTILFLIFLTLKLGKFGEVATWSWWWVTSPLWIPFVAVISIALAGAIIYAIFKIINN